MCLAANVNGAVMIAVSVCFQEVARFLDTKHEGHYRVYNLCSKSALQSFNRKIAAGGTIELLLRSIESMRKKKSSFLAHVKISRTIKKKSESNETATLL